VREGSDVFRKGNIVIALFELCSLEFELLVQAQFIHF
jgi:hypothetical protein